MFKTVSKVLICSLIFSAAAASLSAAPVTDWLFFPSLIIFVLHLSLAVLAWVGVAGQTCYLPADGQLQWRWRTGMAAGAHMTWGHSEVNTDTWGLTKNCQQLLIFQRAGFWAGTVILQIPAIPSGTVAGSQDKNLAELLKMIVADLVVSTVKIFGVFFLSPFSCSKA